MKNLCLSAAILIALASAPAAFANDDAGDGTARSKVKPARLVSFDGERLFFHALGVPEDRRAFIRQLKPLASTLEQPLTGGLFQRPHAASHRGLRQAQPLRGAIQRARAGHRQKDADITPVHRRIQK